MHIKLQIKVLCGLYSIRKNRYLCLNSTQLISKIFSNTEKLVYSQLMMLLSFDICQGI